MKRRIQLVIETDEEKTNSEIEGEVREMIGEFKHSAGYLGWTVASSTIFKSLWVVDEVETRRSK